MRDVLVQQMIMSCNRIHKRRSEQVLPFDSIVEILSWLPVESLLRFKCVCKQWCSLIQDYSFILKNMDRTCTMLLVYPCTSHDDNFEFVSSFAGLCMEKNSATNSTIFRIRNPATHQVLYLPDPPPYTGSVDFGFNSSTGECKVICLYWVRPYVNRDAEFGFKVITIGKDEQWRSLELPDQNKLRKKVVFRGYYIGVNKLEGNCHLCQVLRFTDDEEEEDMYFEVQSLDLWSEHFTTNTLPEGVSLNWNEVHVMRWHNCFSVGYKKKETIDVWVLQDHKEQKWSPNRIIIPVKGPKMSDGRPLLAVEKNIYPSTELDFHISDKGDYSVSKVRKEETAEACESGEILHKPSLISFKGIMMAENGYRPNNKGNQSS